MEKHKMIVRQFTEAERNKLKELVTEGIQIKTEVQTLNEGLRDTVSAIAEELDIKAAILNRAIRTAAKAELEKKRDEFEELESILESIGRG
jgi:hypothetical protein